MVVGAGCQWLGGVLGLAAAGVVSDIGGPLGELWEAVQGVLECWVAGSFSL